MSNDAYGKNVLGNELSSCCKVTWTGFYRDGYCRTDRFDKETHTVCAQLNNAYLNYAKTKGEDLTVHNKIMDTPALRAGDKWCLSVDRWNDALKSNAAPPIFLEATQAKTLETVPLDVLKKHETSSVKNA